MTAGRRTEPWTNSPRHLNGLHRVGAVVFGLGLGVFGVLGAINRLDWFSTSGEPVLGLTSNGLLSLISLVVGSILVAAGIRGGRTASTITVVVGAVFLLSGVANVLVLDSPFNILAFGMPNVIFSLISGGLLLVLGSWGRFTGRLPAGNPYRQDRHPDEGDPLDEQPVDGQVSGRGTDALPTTYRNTADAAAVAQLAEAERAVARNGATAEQIRGVQAAGQARRDEDRLAGWRSDQHPPS
jgi:Domain of unknown function (DUF4383)